jgi:hypothetical protein
MVPGEGFPCYSGLCPNIMVYAKLSRFGFRRDASRSGLCLVSGLLAAIVVGVAPGRLAAADAVEGVVAVSSRVSTDYGRARTADGRYEPEYYAFGEGGHWTSSSTDETIDKLKFMDVATRIAAPLASQNYLPARDTKTTKLVIMLYWGSTQAHIPDAAAMQSLQDANSALAGQKSMVKQQKIAQEHGGPGGPSAGTTAIQAALLGDADNAMSGAMANASAANRSRDEANDQIAALLGYDGAWSDSAKLRGTPLEYRRQDIGNELEEGRYFVVLMAYDFQLMLKERKHKLLWETRFSISQRRNAFDSVLPAMTKYASQYFGQDSDGLLRKSVPLGEVEVGPVKSIGEVAGPAK